MKQEPKVVPRSGTDRNLQPSGWIGRQRSIIARKYGILGRLMILDSRLRRGADGTLGIRVRLTP